MTVLASLRAELLILRRRRTVWALVAVTPALMWITLYVATFVQYRTATPDQYAFYGSPEQILPTMLPGQFVIAAISRFSFSGTAPFAVLGALIAGSGWSSGTLGTALLQRPGRLATLAGQVGALLIAVIVTVVATFALAGVSSVVVALAETGTASPVLGPLPAAAVVARGVGAGVLIAATSGAAGLLLGTVLRNAGGAIAVVLLWTVFVQSLLDNLGLQVGGVFELINDVTPSASAVSVTSVFGSLGGGPDTPMYFRVEPVPAVAALLGYLLGFLALTALVLVRRDIEPGGGRAGRRRRRGRHRPAPAARPPAAPTTIGMLLASVRAETLVAARRPAVWALAATPAVYVLLSGYALPYLFALTAGSGTMSGFSPALILPTLLPDRYADTVMATLGLNPSLGFDATVPFLVLGGLLTGSEWERGTIRTALLQRPGRLATFAGQAITLLAVVVAGVAVTFLLGAAASGAVGLAESGSPFASSDAGFYPPAPVVGGAFAAAVLIGTAYGAIGLALGTALRTFNGPLAVALVWAVIVQPQLTTLAGQAGGVLRTVNDILPSGNVAALVRAFSPNGVLFGNPTGPLVDPATAVVALAVYTALFLTVPAVILRRRDVA